MKLLKKAKKTETVAARVLSSVEVEAIAGGLNPQPLPPRYIRY